MNLLLFLFMLPIKNHVIGVKGDRIYDVKSGILKYISNVPIVNANITVYFDDYGRKKFTEITYSLTGDTVHAEILIVDTFRYTKLPYTNQWVKTYQDNIFSLQNLIFNSISDSVRNLYGISKTVLLYNGLNGNKYIFENNSMNINGAVIEAFGIPLEIDIQKGNMLIEQARAIDMKFNVEVPTQTFNLPNANEIVNMYALKN